MAGKKMFAVFVCILMISAAAFVAVNDIKADGITADDVLNSNPNDITRVSSASDLDDVSYGDIILIEDRHECTDEFYDALKDAAIACHPVISMSGFRVFSEAGFSAVYPEDARFVGYCRDPNDGEVQCKTVICQSDTDSVRRLCEWANGYADDSVRILNSTYGPMKIAKYIFRIYTEDQREAAATEGGELEHLGKSAVSSVCYDTGHGMLNVRTTYNEYSEDDSRRYFRVSYMVESVPWEAGDQYRTADIKIISGIGDGQRLESYKDYSIKDVVIHDVCEDDRYEIWYDIDENTILGSCTYMVQPVIEISTDKSINNGSLRITDIYKVNFCKYGNSGDDWWRIYCFDKCHSFEYYSVALYVEIV